MLIKGKETGTFFIGIMLRWTNLHNLGLRDNKAILSYRKRLRNAVYGSLLRIAVKTRGLVQAVT